MTRVTNLAKDGAMVPEQTPTSDKVAPKTSSRWFFGAVVASLISGALLLGALLGLYRVPSTSSETEAVSEVSAVQPLVVAVARTPGGPGEWANWARVIKYISEEIERPITVRYLSKEDEAAQIIASEDIDMAFVCAHQYLDLRDADVIAGIVTPIVDGEHVTTMRLIANVDDPAESLSDLEGSVVAASDKSSLGGYAYLQYLCLERNVQASDYFAEVLLGDTLESNIRSLSDGDVRATVISTAQTADWDMSQFKVLEESEPVGCPPVVVDKDMDPATRARLAELFLAFDPGTLPADSHVDGFVPLDDADYLFGEKLRDACGHHVHN